MLQLPLYIFLLIYLALTVICAIVFYIAYHHMHSTGTLKGGALFTTLLLGSLGILVIGVTAVSLSDVSWTEPLNLGNAEWFEGISLFPQ